MAIVIQMTEAQVRTTMRLIEMAQENFPQDLHDADIYTESDRAWIVLAQAWIDHEQARQDSEAV